MPFGFPKSQSGSVQESFLTVLLHGMVEVEALLGVSLRQVRGVHIANIVAPAIFGERGILEPGTPSAATAHRGSRERQGKGGVVVDLVAFVGISPSALGGAELHRVGVHGPPGLQRRGAHRPGSAPRGHRALGEAHPEVSNT